MPRWSEHSLREREQLHPKLKKLFDEVVKHIDCRIWEGARTAGRQRHLFQRGRKLVDGEWVVVDRSKVVTYCDGYTIRSNHQVREDGWAWAADVVPWPLDWEDRDRFMVFAGWVQGVAAMMGIPIRWLGDPDSDRDYDDGWDLPHFELLGA